MHVKARKTEANSRNYPSGNSKFAPRSVALKLVFGVFVSKCIMACDLTGDLIYENNMDTVYTAKLLTTSVRISRQNKSFTREFKSIGFSNFSRIYQMNLIELLKFGSSIEFNVGTKLEILPQIFE